MYLGIDTTHNICRVCLVKNGIIKKDLSHILFREQSEFIVPMIKEILNSISIHDIQGIAVVHKPENYTSTRIGIAAAMGLALPWKIPIFGIYNEENFEEKICSISKGNDQKKIYP